MDQVRRKFLRLLLISGGAFVFFEVFGLKLLSSLSSFFGQSTPLETPTGPETQPQELSILSKLRGMFLTGPKDFPKKGTDVKMLGEDFKVLESKDKLIFINKKGEEIFSIDEEGAIEIGP